MSQVLNHLGSICAGFPALVSGQAGSYTFSSALPSSFGLGKAVPSGHALSDLAMPFMNLDCPGGGILNGQSWSAISVGGCVAPSSGGTVNVALISNTFSTIVTAPGSADDVHNAPYGTLISTSVNSYTRIVTASQVLATLPIAQSLLEGPTQCSLEADFSGDSSSGILNGTFLIVVGSVETTGVLVQVSSWDSFKRPSLQLSMAIIFGNSADVFQGSMTCFNVSR